jgi:C4-dicarboxylate-specific signal transduction histidine kinase
MYIATTQRSALMTALTDSNLLNQKLEANETKLVSYRDNLEHMVKEKTTELEITNARLLETSRTLEARSRSHLLQQQELETILEELHSKQAKLMETGKLAAIGMLTAGMAHEINNPLNFINGAVQLMEMELTGSPHSAVFTGSIQRIRESVSRTSTLVGSLNQFGRKTDSMEEVCDLSKISSNVLSILELADSKNKIHLVLPEKQTSIKGNAGKLHQALLNLLQEAVQDVREGGQLQLKLSIEEQEVSLMLEQTNQTAPINAQVENFRTSGRENLRMYICHRIIKEHSGRLLVTLDPNGRKKREIRLPLHT